MFDLQVELFVEVELTVHRNGEYLDDAFLVFIEVYMSLLGQQRLVGIGPPP